MRATEKFAAPIDAGLPRAALSKRFTSSEEERA
jgi:hypothetical protein